MAQEFNFFLGVWQAWIIRWIIRTSKTRFIIICRRYPRCNQKYWWPSPTCKRNDTQKNSLELLLTFCAISPFLSIKKIKFQVRNGLIHHLNWKQQLVFGYWNVSYHFIFVQWSFLKVIFIPFLAEQAEGILDGVRKLLKDSPFKGSYKLHRRFWGILLETDQTFRKFQNQTNHL